METDEERMERERLEALARAEDLPFDVKVCPSCRKLRAIPKGRDYCPICRHSLTESDLTHMNVPQEFWRASFAGLTESVRDVARNYLGQMPKYFAQGTGLLFYGPPGRGKTGAAVTLLKACRERFKRGYFLRAGEFRTAMKEQHDFDADTTVMDRVREVDVLVLDSFSPADLTLPYLKMSDLIELVASRGSRQRVTFLTTTMSQGELAAASKGLFIDAVGTYLVSVPVEGEDRRSKQRETLAQELFAQETTSEPKSKREKR